MHSSRRRILTMAVLVLSTIMALLPGPAAAQDGDYDGLPDSLELALAQRFFPILNLHCGTYRGYTYGDRRQLYGLSVSGYPDSSIGRIPFVAHPYNPGDWRNCTEDYQCIELRYGIAWNWDLGDDTFGGGHQGDSETYAILLARKDPGGSGWGVTWEQAQNDATQWRLIKEFMSAHWGAAGDSSSFRSHGYYGNTTYQRVWCAEGKHAMYPSQNACNNGGYADADDCSDNRCDIVTEIFQKVQNVGEPFAWLNPYIPYPGGHATQPPSSTVSYNVWSGYKFGTAGSYKSHFERPLNWCPTYQYCLTDCNYGPLECPAGDFFVGGCSQDCGWGMEPGGIMCETSFCS